jgi:endonuclease/exonuclease/phosphatase family metal-dependent hydrolase
VLQWNVAYGRGTDNVVDLNRQATWMANMRPDLISLNEVPPENIQRYVDLLRQKTGIAWYSHWYAIRSGDRVGQQILSRFPFVRTGGRYLTFGRSVAHVTVTVGGRTVNFFSTHLSYESAAWRTTQLTEMNAWLAGFPEQRIIAGDYNLTPTSPEHALMAIPFYDSWAEAAKIGKAISYADNPEGRTRKARLDYINYSKFAGGLRLVEVRMPDQRNLSNKNVVVRVGNSNDWGVRPSDHNFLITTLEVR